LATVFFIGITLLFLDFTGALHLWLGWMAKVQFLPALLALNVVVVVVLLLLTLVFGRIYCSVICPLGVMQDVISRLGIWWRSRRNKKNRRGTYSFSPAKTWLRYGVLAVVVVAFALGLMPVVALLEPYSAFGRIASSLFQPVYLTANNALAAISEHFDSYAFYSKDVWMRGLSVLIVALVTFVVVAVLAWRNGRTWCNTICPVGTLLSFFSRFSLMKIRFDADKCRSCSKCSRNCKASCIDFRTHTVDYSRCVVCGNCLEQCEFGALKYAIRGERRVERGEKPNPNPSPREGSSNPQTTENKPQTAENNPQTIDRRSFLLTAALATSATALAEVEKKVDGGLAEIEDKIAPKRLTPLTPPGSISAQNMAHHCTACQLCVAECPNDVLRPSSDLQHFMQPTMSYERGFCRPECTRCSEVCPTGAIIKIDKAEKSSTQIGHAVWIKKNCVPVTDGVSCGNCADKCPTGAIEMVTIQVNGNDVDVPAVNESRCIGCGKCEYVCPARPFSAIYVEGHEQHKTM